MTDHDSPSGYREFLPGLADGGDVSFAIALDITNTAHVGAAGTGLIGSMETDGCTIPAWQLTLNVCTGTAIWTFDGYVNSMGFGEPIEGENTADIGVKITGKPTLAVT